MRVVLVLLLIVCFAAALVQAQGGPCIKPQFGTQNSQSCRFLGANGWVHNQYCDDSVASPVCKDFTAVETAGTLVTAASEQCVGLLNEGNRCIGFATGSIAPGAESKCLSGPTPTDRVNEKCNPPVGTAAAGAACKNGAFEPAADRCAPGLFCNSYMKCQEMGKVNEPCPTADTEQCGVGLTCNAGVCTPMMSMPVGSFVSSSSACESLTAMGSQCYPAYATARSTRCMSDEDCKTGSGFETPFCDKRNPAGANKMGWCKDYAYDARLKQIACIAQKCSTSTKYMFDRKACILEQCRRETAAVLCSKMCPKPDWMRDPSQEKDFLGDWQLNCDKDMTIDDKDGTLTDTASTKISIKEIIKGCDKFQTDGFKAANLRQSAASPLQAASAAAVLLAIVSSLVVLF